MCTQYCFNFHELSSEYFLMISRLSSNMGHVSSKMRSISKILLNIVVHSRRHSFTSSFMELIRMFVLMISWSNSNVGHVGLKTSSLNQILFKRCLHSTGYRFASIFMLLHQNIYLDDISVKFEYRSCQVKT